VFLRGTGSSLVDLFPNTKDVTRVKELLRGMMR